MEEYKAFGSKINNENKFDDYFEHMKIKKGDSVFFEKDCEAEVFYSEKQLESNRGELEMVEKGMRGVVVKDNGDDVDLKIDGDDSVVRHISKLSLKRIK